jgi:hypothetical protein
MYGRVYYPSWEGHESTGDAGLAVGAATRAATRRRRNHSMPKATRAKATVTVPTMAIITTLVLIDIPDRLGGFAAAGSSSGVERSESPPRTTAAPGTPAVVAERDGLPGDAVVAGCEGPPGAAVVAGCDVPLPAAGGAGCEPAAGAARTRWLRRGSDRIPRW